MSQTPSKKKSAETFRHVWHGVSLRRSLILSPKKTVHPVRRLHLRTSLNWTMYPQSLDMTRSAFSVLTRLLASCSAHAVTCAYALNAAPRFTSRQWEAIKSVAILEAHGTNFSTEQSNVPFVAPTPKQCTRVSSRGRCTTASACNFSSSSFGLVVLASYNGYASKRSEDPDWTACPRRGYYTRFHAAPHFRDAERDGV